MKPIRLLPAVALWAALSPLAAPAQTAAPQAASAPAIAASVAPPATPEKRALTPAEQRDSATLPGDLRPTNRVSPQLAIPLTKSGPPKAELIPQPRGKTAPAGGIDDAAARCGAMADAQAREQCRDKLAR